MSALLAELRRRMAGPLPGLAAQKQMAPRPRRGWQPGRIPAGSRPGAALTLLHPDQDRPHVVLTLRAAGLPNHAGQVSFPGGGIERSESFVDAALREAHEEVGLEPEGVEVLGMLTPLHIPASGFALFPVVAWHPGPLNLQANPHEVERILHVSLAELADRRVLEVTRRTHEGLTYDVPYFAVAGQKVWGATAMILAELLAVVDRAPDPWARRAAGD